jgi:hypothetical protein
MNGRLHPAPTGNFQGLGFSQPRMNGRLHPDMAQLIENRTIRSLKHDKNNQILKD